MVAHIPTKLLDLALWSCYGSGYESILLWYMLTQTHGHHGETPCFCAQPRHSNPGTKNESEHTHMYLQMSMYTCVYVCVKYTYTYMYIYVYTHRQGEKERERDREMKVKPSPCHASTPRVAGFSAWTLAARSGKSRPLEPRTSVLASVESRFGFIEYLHRQV